MRATLGLLVVAVVAVVVAGKEECPDFECPAKDGSFAVIGDLLGMVIVVVLKNWLR